MSRSQILIVLPPEEDSASALAAEETLRHFSIPAERVFATGGNSKTHSQRLPLKENIFCLIVRQHPRAIAWAERHYPDALMLMMPRCSTDCSNALESLKEAAKKPLGKAQPTFALGKAGEINAALFAVTMLAVHQPNVRAKLLRYRKEQTRAVVLNAIRQ